MELSAPEGRVLGCLVEKQLTTPQLYPLTENALLAACNQTTSRDPVVAYDVATVRLAVRGLRERGLLRTVHRTGERSDKHQHLLEPALGLAALPAALLGVLLLRGPQTVAELRARTERMAPATAEEVEAALAALAARDEPLVARLPRQPGRKEARYGQLLTPDARLDEPAPAPAASPLPPAGPPLPAPAAPAELRAEVAELRAEVAELRAEVAELRGQVAGLRGQVAALQAAAPAGAAVAAAPA